MTTRFRTFVPLLTLALAQCSAQDSEADPRPTASPGAATSQPSATPSLHFAFDRILQQSVRDERVDYLAIADRQLPALDAYLDLLAHTEVQALERPAQLAFYINLYNATVIRAVIDRHQPGWNPSADDFAIFDDKELVRLQTGKISLNDLEKKVIIPTFAEPRIHVALVCAARSCPSLLPRAYAAHDLDQVLEANMKRFLNDPSRNPVDHDQKKLRLSQIFNWYKDDFGGDAGLPAYVNRYTEKDTSGYAIEFSEYSWELNIAPPKEADK